MEKQFKDVAHLYLGCTVKTHPNFRPNIKERIEGKQGFAILTENLLADEADGTFPFKSKPLLYPLSAMTEEQVVECYEVVHNCKPVDSIADTAEYIEAHLNDECAAKTWIWACNNHLDIFGLIESGEAIDVTTLEVNPYK